MKFKPEKWKNYRRFLRLNHLSVNYNFYAVFISCHQFDIPYFMKNRTKKISWHNCRSFFLDFNARNMKRNQFACATKVVSQFQTSDSENHPPSKIEYLFLRYCSLCSSNPNLANVFWSQMLLLLPEQFIFIHIYAYILALRYAAI